VLKFLLVILLAGADGVQPVHIEPFADAQACEKQRTAVVKQIPHNVSFNFVAACMPVRNATQTES
jgi:hypothetical protein